ncbi:MAG TPA: hypothetical protein PK894_04025 [Defluviitoga sp.]|nr:hypothetical protein [Defluviitoga sp.]HOP24416.1 hypothetical protein [Defluviitoga sp.]HPZ28747.1 hypothetical protein [Defluviitoga sp.]HQD62749.1 hypothetical protein [Defluviitoga sp.]
MIILKGIYGDFMKLRPSWIKKIYVDDNSIKNEKGPELFEKYIYEVDGRFGNYRWFNNEFNLDDEDENEDTKLQALKIDIEYIPLILTILRINAFFESDKKSIVSLLSTEQENRTVEIITEEFLVQTLNEYNKVVFVYLKKLEKGIIDHHLVFSTGTYGNFFDLSIHTDEKGIRNFYRNLLNETNNFRVAILPSITQSSSPYYHKILEKLEIVNYEDILGITDDFFSLYDISLNEIVPSIPALEDLEIYASYCYTFLHEDDFYFSDEFDFSLDFTVKNIEDLEDEIRENINESIEFYSNEFYSEDDSNSDDYFEVFLQLEEEFMNFMDRIMFDDTLSEDAKRKYLKGVKNLINEISVLFNDLKSKKEFEKDILLDLINAYGIDQIKLKKNLFSEIFDEIDMEKDLKEVYEISEDKFLNDYKKWYKDVIDKKGKSMIESIKN